MSPVRNLNMSKFEIATLAVAMYILVNFKQKWEEFLTG